MNFQKITYKRLYEDILEQLLAYIREANLQLGDKLPTERELAEGFGTSRGTLREAFRILENNGYIESRPGGGRYLIKGLSDFESGQSVFVGKSYKDIDEFRLVFDPGVAALAADNATEEDINNLYNSIRKTTSLKEQAIADNAEINPDRIIDYDEDSYFHLLLARATHNVLIYEIAAQYTEIAKEVRFTRIHNSNQAVDVLSMREAEHINILRAVEAHDADAARNAMLVHINNGIERHRKGDELST